MILKLMKFALICLLMGYFLSCMPVKTKPVIDESSVQPGTSVTVRGKSLKLLGTPLSVGKTLPSVSLVDAMTMQNVDLSKERSQVLFLSIVPSLDTPVCEAQTHYLGEQGDKLSGKVKRITISRDTPFAQKRFAKEAKLTDLQYLSDYKEGAFGRSLGLLIEDLMLLARSVIIVDGQGIVQYIQVVPETSHLPDMERAFQKALALAS
jgi:thiol peroxidase